MRKSKMAIGLGGMLGVVLAAATVMAQGGGQAPAAQQPPPPPPSIKIGEAVPDFTLPYMSPKAGGGYENKDMKLSDFKGEQNVVLAFFPAAFSPGCTSEMQKYHASTGQFTAVNTAIFGVSVDSTWANKAFREQIGAEFPILSDWKKDLSRKLGVLDENSGFARRTTFVIDKQGVLKEIIQGRDALDPSGVVGMCEKLHKGTM
jgi:peroxiredoxin